MSKIIELEMPDEITAKGVIYIKQGDVIFLNKNMKDKPIGGYWPYILSQIKSAPAAGTAKGAEKNTIISLSQPTQKNK